MVTTNNHKIRIENNLIKAKNNLELLQSITRTKKLNRKLSNNFEVHLENGIVREAQHSKQFLIVFVGKCKLNTAWENTVIEFSFNSLEEMSINAILHEIEMKKANLTKQIEYLETDLSNFEKDSKLLIKLYEDFVSKINKHDFSIGIRASVLSDFNTKLVNKEL